MTDDEQQFIEDEANRVDERIRKLASTSRFRRLARRDPFGAQLVVLDVFLEEGLITAIGRGRKTRYWAAEGPILHAIGKKVLQMSGYELDG